LSTRPRTERKIGLVVAALVIGLAACSKLPESETASKIGAQPKQTIDKASSDVTKSLQTGTETRQDAESKQSEGK
jgi:uncharacterized lipoprotein